jgi:hypothetical protein
LERAKMNVVKFLRGNLEKVSYAGKLRKYYKKGK